MKVFPCSRTYSYTYTHTGISGSIWWDISKKHMMLGWISGCGSWEERWRGDNEGRFDQNRLYACVEFSNNKKVKLNCVSVCCSSLSVQDFVLCFYHKKAVQNPSSNEKTRNKAHKSFPLLNKTAVNNNPFSLKRINTQKKYKWSAVLIIGCGEWATACLLL